MTAGTRLSEETSISVSRKDHGAGAIGDAIARVCGHIVQELVDSLGCVLGGSGLLGANGAEGGKKFVVNSAGIVE